MDVPWLRFDQTTPSEDEQARIQEVLRAGQLIILPTDTVYGVAADERVEGTEQAIYEAKRRPANLLLPRLAASLSHVEAHGATVGAEARKLAEKFWPGALTLVLPHPDLGSVGYRVPEDPVALAVLEAAEFPLLVTSANLSGEPETTTAEAAFASLAPSIAMVLDAGPAPSKVPSSVVRVTGNSLEVLREGVVSSAAIEETLRA